MVKWYTIVTILVVGVAIFLNYPPPEFSSQLNQWKDNGQYFTYKEHQIFYTDSPGKGNKDNTVICLHGFPTSSYDWKKVWPTLVGTFRKVLALDFVGFGFSDKPKEHSYSIMEQADIVEQLLLNNGISQVHLLAHDYGDTVAQELLYRFDNKKLTKHPSLVIKSVCLLNGGILPETNFPRAGQKLLLDPRFGPVLSHLMNYFSFKRGLGEVFGSKTQPTSEEMWDFWAAIRFNDGHKIAHDLLQYIPERHANRDHWVGVLQKTKVPVRIIYGPADPVNPPVFMDRYRELVPHAVISMLDPHISHYPQLEDPVSTMGAYREFLKRNGFI